MISFEDISSGKTPVAVIGLGYVGLPLAISLSKHFQMIGFDISPSRIAELRSGRDRTGEVAPERLDQSGLHYTEDAGELRQAGVLIVAVPTPIDVNRKPDLRAVTGATRIVGERLRPGAVVVYESTVYPGLTEEICVPLLEETSGLRCGPDFTVGYSPERINPGDKVHTVDRVTKIVSGQDHATAELLAKIYGAVTAGGIHMASSIRVAEAAKVIENTQRDLNIALMNELAMLFDRMEIDTGEVLAAAGSKWNFLPFRPGLVGGHCIGVDPYYLTFKAESLGFYPQAILAGRHINDGMGKFIAEKTVKKMIQANCRVKGARIGILGLTFKENVPDLRNSKVVDILRELEEYQLEILVTDPLGSPEEAKSAYGVELVPLEALRELDAVILAVAHTAFASLDAKRLRGMFRDPASAVIIDVKGFLDRESLSKEFLYWRL